MQKNILRKSLEISGALNDEGIFTGYASVFGVVDETGDIIEPGAFADTLAIGEASNGVMIFGQHEDYRPPIGKSIELREDQTGLFVRGKISSTEEGLTYRQLVKDGVLTKMSIGYIPVEYFVDKDGIRHLTKVELLEISIVNYPANTMATIESYKGGNRRMSKKNTTPEDAKARKSDGQDETQELVISAEDLANMLEDAAEAGAVKALKSIGMEDEEKNEDPEGEEKNADPEDEEKNEDPEDEGKGRKSRTLQYQRKARDPRQEVQRKYAGIYMNTGAEPEKKSTQLPKGHAWVKYQKAMIRAGGDYDHAAHILRKQLGAPQMEREVKAIGQNMTTPTDGGYLVPEVYAAEVIELLYAQAVVLKLGATVIPMDNGNMNIPKMTRGTSASYVGELRKPKASQASFGNVKLSAKKLMSKIIISNDLIRSNAYNADGLILNDAVMQMALAMDKAALMGRGTEFEPLGLFNTKDVLKVVIGGVPDPLTTGAMLAKMIQANANTSSLGWALNGFAWQKFYDVMDKQSYDYTYRHQMDQGKLMQYPLAISNQIEVASDTNKTTKIILGNWSDFLIGRQGQMESEFFREGTVEVDGQMVSAVDNDAVILRCIDLHDFGVRHPESFVIGEGLHTA